MPARFQNPSGLLEMVAIGRGHVHHADAIITQKLVEITINPARSPAARPSARPLKRRAQQTDDFTPIRRSASTCTGPDEAPADNGGPGSSRQSQMVNPSIVIPRCEADERRLEPQHTEGDAHDQPHEMRGVGDRAHHSRSCRERATRA